MRKKVLIQYIFYTCRAIQNLKMNIYHKPIHLWKKIFYFFHENDPVPFIFLFIDHEIFISLKILFSLKMSR